MIVILNVFFLSSYAQEGGTDSLSQALGEIVIVNTNPIAEKYASIQLKKMEVYFNPASSGDPLKAIALLPLSTNTSESAAPMLRGGRADQSLVYLNGAPIYNPTRHAQEDGVGSFSLFNTEMIDRQDVYASNPPLTYGNSSAGIVSIESTKSMDRDSYQAVAALSTLGLQLNKKIGKTDFVQFYANTQFSDVLKAINKRSLEDLNSFQSKDGGLNLRIKFAPRLVLNSYSYAIEEYYDSKSYNLVYRADAQANQRRFFTVNTLAYTSAKSLFKLVSLGDWSTNTYQFKTIDSHVKNKQFYLEISHKYHLMYNWNLQYGGSLATNHYAYKEIKPLYYYAMEKEHPTVAQREDKQLETASLYLYTDYKFSNRLGVSLGIRKNTGIKEKQFDFWSHQVSAFYKVNANHRFIVGLGTYHSYTPPNYYNHQIEVMRSKQLAVDYYYERGNTAITGAVYWKKDQGKEQLSALEQVSNQEILGFEWSYTQLFNRFFSLALSNSVLRREQEINQEHYTHWALFSKAQLTYSNPKYLTASVVCNSHPGDPFIPLGAASYEPHLNVFIPQVESSKKEYMNSYFRIDLTVNRLFPIGTHYLIAYCSIVNLLDRKNQRKPYYASDYTRFYYQDFQRRVLYLGIQFKF
ncbi:MULTISPECIES: TonB-dependent receptor plug domain-containing protein [unclassified Myroides]|uniref:TonB-dependent receptor plug domain-containing protein n=1 Tax=unclassified Myroides TaxID=2642485 RepID=UPI003D2F5C82